VARATAPNAPSTRWSRTPAAATAATSSLCSGGCVAFPRGILSDYGRLALAHLSDARKLLLEGRPGVGKTTLAERIAARLRDAGLPLSGFVTREIRERGRRLGFSIETMDGRRATLAHVDFPGPPRVGKYGVDLGVLDRTGVPALRVPSGKGVVILDELGKMELASEAFRDAVLHALDGPAMVVATVHVARHPFTDALKRRSGVEVVRVTHRNRDRLPESLAELLIG
jgi:nucleoside-triphosphatase